MVCSGLTILAYVHFSLNSFQVSIQLVWSFNQASMLLQLDSQL